MKRTKKESRTLAALMGLVELYLKTGKPVGSHTLQEHGFEKLSSATLRNYFAELEQEGYLKQAHTSGGRIPTEKAFHLYAETALNDPEIENGVAKKIKELKDQESKNIALYLQRGVDLLSELTGCAAFLSAARFDHDSLSAIRLVTIDHNRLLCVLLTDFGQIFTEVFNLDQKLSTFTLNRLEQTLQWRIKAAKNEENPLRLTPEEEAIVVRLYNEIMVRYLVRYTHFSQEEVHKTGFSKLLAFPEFSDPLSLTSALSLFENTASLRLLLNDTLAQGKTHFWIGKDLLPYASSEACTVIATPYRIGPVMVGALGILGPVRVPYKTLFGTLDLFANTLSGSLTKTLHKYKLTFRQPRSGSYYLENESGKNNLNLIAVEFKEKKNHD